MNSKTRVSVGLPVYNGQKYLEATLISILNQTYPDFELIISDNGSTDRTQAICMKYVASDDRVRYYRNEKNLGVAPNYNRVFDLSCGEYFKWADYDDILTPDFLEKCVDVLDHSPETAVCFPRAKLIDENGDWQGDYDPRPDTSSPKNYERFGNLILHPARAVHAMGLMRSSIIRQTGMHEGYPSSDEVFIAEMALHSRFTEIPDRLLWIRVHPEQSTKGALASQRNRVLFFDTSLEGKTVLLKWLYFRGCLRAIRNAPMNLRERGACYLVMLRWLFVPQNFRSMCKDALLGLKELARTVLNVRGKSKPAMQKTGRTL